MPKLRVQVTLSSNPHAQPAHAGEESVRTIAVSGRRLQATFTPDGPLVAGGSAVHGTLVPHDADGGDVLPPGTQFELWEHGRVGHGTVLAAW